MDVATEEDAAAAQRGIRALNPYAPITETVNSDAPIAELIGLGAFDLNRLQGTALLSNARL